MNGLLFVCNLHFEDEFTMCVSSDCEIRAVICFPCAEQCLSAEIDGDLEHVNGTDVTSDCTGRLWVTTVCFKRNVSENANASYEKTNNARKVKIYVWQP